MAVILNKTLVWSLGILCGCAGWAATAADSDLAARVVILANSRQRESVRLAEFYAEKRAVPVANIIALPLPETESITWREFIDQVYQPLQDELYRRGWISGTSSSLLDRLGRRRYAFDSQRIAYLVTCRGVPLRIYNDPTLLPEKPARKIPGIFNKNEGAVDSELSLIARGDYEITALVSNPLYANLASRTFEAEMIVKVSRLDGPTFADARHLVTSALEGERTGLLGRYYVDFKGPHPDADQWFTSVRSYLTKLGYDGDVEDTRATFGVDARFDAPVFYFGWYAGAVNGPFKREGFAFPPGAIALHIHSFSAGTLHGRDANWTGPLVARGAAATVGNVFEPYLQLTHRPELLLRALIDGKTFGDAAYYSLPALSWQAIAVGDPLYRPFKVSLEDQEGMKERLPPSLAPYAAVRRANLLAQRGAKVEALAFLKDALHTQPDLVTALALAQRALAEKDQATAVAALDFAPALKKIPGEDWPVLREAAELLAANGARPAALQIYANLAAVKPPSNEALKKVLTEARDAADALGDLKRSLEFAQRLNDLNPPPASEKKDP